MTAPRPNLVIIVADDTKIRVHNPMWMTDGALAFLDAARRDGRPFYLHLANSVPHSPDCNLSLNADHRYTWGGKLNRPPASHPPDDTVLERLRAAGLQTEGPIAGVNAGMVMLDDQVGAVLRRLDEFGLADRTIVVYTADHGIPGKGSCHAIGQHLPFVKRWPGGLTAGRVVPDIFSWADVVPTLAEACGVSLPPDHRIDGVSVLGALRGEAPWPRRVAFHEMGWSRSVIAGRRDGGVARRIAADHGDVVASVPGPAGPVPRDPGVPGDARCPPRRDGGDPALPVGRRAADLVRQPSRSRRGGLSARRGPPSRAD